MSLFLSNTLPEIKYISHNKFKTNITIVQEEDVVPEEVYSDIVFI